MINEQTSNPKESKISLFIKKRHLVFILATIITIIVPFITINGNHIFLMSFEERKLDFLFRSFSIQELYVLPFLIIVVFVGVFFVTAMFGRFWCGWCCPMTIYRFIYRDIIATKLLHIRKSSQNKQIKIEKKYFRRGVAILIWALLSLLAAANFTWFFIPPEVFFERLKDPLVYKGTFIMVFAIAAFLIFLVTKIKETFCIYMCPYARLQSVMYDKDTIQPIYDEERGGIIYDRNGNKMWNRNPDKNTECIGCNKCVTVCPSHIDIRKGTQLECINCLECNDACIKVMKKLKKNTLIEWSSYGALSSHKKPHIVRPRTIGYGVILSIVLIVLMAFDVSKSSLLSLNINRSSQLYTTTDDGNTIENSYIFLLHNQDSKDHTFYFRVISPKNIKIELPRSSFDIEAGQTIKKVVLLSAKKKSIGGNLSNTNKQSNKTTSLTQDMIVEAYSVGDSNITVTQKSVFIYPNFSS